MDIKYVEFTPLLPLLFPKKFHRDGHFCLFAKKLAGQTRDDFVAFLASLI